MLHDINLTGWMTV